MKRSLNLKADVVGLLVKQMKREGLPQAIREHRFHPTRKWQFDLAYPDLKLAFEYEGGIFSGGAHTRGKHFQSDCEKYNTAALMGWRVFRLYGDMIFKGQREMDEGWKLIKKALDVHFGNIWLDVDSGEFKKTRWMPPIPKNPSPI